MQLITQFLQAGGASMLQGGGQDQSPGKAAMDQTQATQQQNQGLLQSLMQMQQPQQSQQQPMGLMDLFRQR